MDPSRSGILFVLMDVLFQHMPPSFVLLRDSLARFTICAFDVLLSSGRHRQLLVLSSHFQQRNMVMEDLKTRIKLCVSLTLF